MHLPLVVMSSVIREVLFHLEILSNTPLAP